jgi:hypothetical protein
MDIGSSKDNGAGVYFFDHQGDRNNDSYESMYRYDVPRYRTREGKRGLQRLACTNDSK